jgi:phosphinothricin acetyltransferase
MIVRDCQEADLEAILDIHNDAVLTSTAIWDDTIVDLENRRGWLRARVSAGFPVLAADDGGQVLGYASYGVWRARDGYRHTVEHSVYVHKEARRKGIATALMLALIERSRAQRLHAMIGAVEATNRESLAFHAKLGFEKVAFMPEVGRKFGRWLDLVFVQLLLDRDPKPQP